MDELKTYKISRYFKLLDGDDQLFLVSDYLKEKKGERHCQAKNQGQAKHIFNSRLEDKIPGRYIYMDSEITHIYEVPPPKRERKKEEKEKKKKGDEQLRLFDE